MIISVGYRVKSHRGTQFRQWATRILRDHLVQGFTVNQTRLAEKGISEMQQAVELLARTLAHQALITDIGRVYFIFRAILPAKGSTSSLIGYDKK